MTPAATSLQDFRERTADVEEYLGRVVFTSNREANIQHSILEQILTDEGLADFVPSAPADVDVYRVVTTAGGRNRIDLGDGRKMNLLIRQVANDEQEIVRRVVAETVDSAGRKLDHDGVIDIVFDKQTASAFKRYAPAAGLVPQEAETLADELVAAYQSQRGCVGADRLRSIASRILDKSHGVVLRSTGGVYFVPRDHIGLIDKLERASRKLPGFQVESLKLLDEGDGRQKAMVHTAADSDIASQAARLLKELNDLTAEGGVTDRRRTSLMREFGELQARATAHEELLSAELDQSRIQFAQLQWSLTQVVTS